jgi:hypothetical protein
MNKMIWVWIALGLALLALAHYLAVLAWLRRRREKINFLLMGLLLPRYLNRYRDLSQQETGRTGIHFYGYGACINLALAAFLVFLLV